MHRASHRYLVGTHDRCTHVPKRRLEIFAEGREKFCEYFRGRICGIYSGESSLKSRGELTYFLSPAKKKSSESWLEKKKEKKKGKRGKRRSRNEWKRCERSNFEVVLAGQGGEGKIVDIVDPTGTRYSKTAEEFEFFFQKQVKFQ